MLISVVAVSGFYAGITIVPLLGNAQFSLAPKRTHPIVRVQGSEPAGTAADIAHHAVSDFAPFPAEAQFQTGDSWISGGRRYRLFGLQACLRGTAITVSQGVARDCGVLNVIMAQALIRDTKPVCTTIQEIDRNNVVVACQTTSGEHRYDLATYMIAQGWGFAAVDGAGHLIVSGYRIAEESARSVRAGLWAYPDMPHPVSVLVQQAGASR